MPKAPPIATDISRLVSVFAALQTRGIFVTAASKNDNQDDGLLCLSVYDYSEEFNDFLQEISASCWTVSSYSAHDCAKKIKSRKLVKTCSLSDLLELLTYCWRSNRFCTGYLESRVADGTIFRIVARLRQFGHEG